MNRNENRLVVDTHKKSIIISSHISFVKTIIYDSMRVFVLVTSVSFLKDITRLGGSLAMIVKTIVLCNL